MKKRMFVNKMKHVAALGLASVMLISLTPQKAFASDYINAMKIKLDIELNDGEALPSLSVGYYDDTDAEVMIPENRRYDIAYAEWSNDELEAEMGEDYRLKVTLTAEDDYVFRNSYSSSKFEVSGGSFVSARRGDSKDELIVTLKTRKVEGILEIPQDVEWKTENSNHAKFGYASWNKVNNADYDVQLYRDGNQIYRVNAYNRTSINFYPYMTKEGDYQFRVRAIPSSDKVSEYAERSEWEYSDELYVADDEVSDGSGQGQETVTDTTPNITNPDLVGWIQAGNKWFFRYPDGTYLRNCWGKIDNAWYLFDESGEMLTGWHKRNNAWYYMNGSGAMHTGWLWYENAWYYLDSNGVMRTGWVTVDHQTYYMDASGAMQTGWEEIDGLWYYFYPDGHKAVNEVISGFYVDLSGVWKRP